MLLVIHIVVALASIGFASVLLFAPTSTRLRISYSLIGLTFATGIGLVVVSPAHMLHACISGIVYAMAVTGLTAYAQVKLKRTELG